MARPRTPLDQLERRGSPVAKRRRRELRKPPPRLTFALAAAMAERWDAAEAAEATGIDIARLDAFMDGHDLPLAELDAIGIALGLRLCWTHGEPVE